MTKPPHRRQAPTTRTQEERSAAARRTIVDAALRCYERLGRAVPLEAIAREAGVSKSLVLYHFGSRVNLLLAAQDRFVERVVSETLAGVRPERPTAEQAVAALRQAWQALRRQPPPLSLLMELMAARDKGGAMERELSSHLTHARTLVREGIERLLGDVTLRQQMPVQAMADLVIAGIVGLQTWGELTDLDGELDRLFEHWAGMVRAMFPQAEDGTGAA